MCMRASDTLVRRQLDLAVAVEILGKNILPLPLFNVVWGPVDASYINKCNN